MSVMVVKLTPKIEIGWTKNSGALKNLGVEPKNTLNTFSKKKLTPIAVMSIEILGALRKGV